MHILITNDDGPPSSHSSPYVHCLVEHLKAAGHTVSVCLPHTQRSWIGKAHIIGQTLKPVYYRPSASLHGEGDQGTTHTQPRATGDGDDWVLIDGTPASCTQIGLNHLFKDKGPVDLVVSGPNYGRNTTAVFALSSGTMGAALEGAALRKKSIALSFAFFTRNHDPVIIEAACKHSVRVIEALYKQWPSDNSVDLYSVNVPLVEGVDTHKTIFTEILQNYWTDGGCFTEVEDGAPDGVDAEEELRQEQEGGAPATGYKRKCYKWAPKFTDVYKSVEDGGPGSDGWVVQEGNTSVTPLKANFAMSRTDKLQKELELEGVNDAALPHKKETPNQEEPQFRALIAYEDEYVQPLILNAFESLLPKDLVKITSALESQNSEVSAEKWLASANSRALQITPYETIDFEYAASHDESYLINSYMIRKALIRKHYISTTMDHWVAKNPTSVLKKHMKRSDAFEVDYAEFLDDALIEAFDLRESLDRNQAVENEQDQEWWILKPGMSDRGQGIRLFSTMDQLQEIFDTWEAERPDSDDEDEIEDADRDTTGDEAGDYITASHLRHFVAQPYIHPPLLMGEGGHKFHIRTYVLCVGSLQVYVYKHMLALFAAKPYSPPWESPDDLETFLTNTCIQESPNDNTVQRFWNLPLPKEKLDAIFAQICGVTGEIFEAAARAMPIHFQTMPNAFEVFGLDYLVDADGTAWLLEINAFPDFKQTGGDLQEIVQGFWKGVVREAVVPFFGINEAALLSTDGSDDMVPVRSVDLGRR